MIHGSCGCGNGQVKAEPGWPFDYIILIVGIFQKKECLCGLAGGWSPRYLKKGGQGHDNVVNYSDLFIIIDRVSEIIGNPG